MFLYSTKSMHFTHSPSRLTEKERTNINTLWLRMIKINRDTFSSEPVVPCPARNAKRISESAAPTICNNKVLKNRDIRSGNQICNTIKRPCGRSCCSAVPTRGRKLTDSNMFLLLRQSDAGNLQGPDESTMTVCETPFTRNVEVPLLSRCEM